ncbi:MAG: beta-L-arabinofuranosidase domain-containing protein [Flavitalea sp.]
MSISRIYFFAISTILFSIKLNGQQPVATAKISPVHIIRPLDLREVRIEDQFWSPRLKLWDQTTVYDVLDKLEGKYEPDREDIIREKQTLGRTRDAFRNFDEVAKGKVNTGSSDGPPWYDGLVYESIRGASDLMVSYPDPKLDAKLDAYIKRIAAAQDADKDGYINTYTTLVKPNQRWGTNGGDDRWQHDVYNAGTLVEAGVHHYRATGKISLLKVAVKMANYMASVMGEAPKQNIIPAHAGPEEAFLKLYLLFKDESALKQKIQLPVNEKDWYDLVTYWIEKRGVLSDPDGSRKRMGWGSYNQDHIPVLQQTTIEGHAVRATLLATGLAMMAQYNDNAAYVNTANNYWNNMIGKRMFITGGQGAIAYDEKFGDDYFLPESAYLETCASVGAAFFSQRMNELHADGKYIDEFERVIYNNMLSAISADGQHYHYENPLISKDHKRWNWHSCPCCPPMFLKMIGSLPQFIYAKDARDLYVNLFIGSEAQVRIGSNEIAVKQSTGYPWKGNSSINIDPKKSAEFTVFVRVPGWAVNKENPFDLYTSSVKNKVTISVNGKPVNVNPVNGYAAIKRKWKKGDVIDLNLPVEPRLVTPNISVNTIKGKMAIAAGPLIYAVESPGNSEVKNALLKTDAGVSEKYNAQLLNGINEITGTFVDGDKNEQFKAIPFFAVGNNGVHPYKVWLPADKYAVKPVITINTKKVENKISPLIYGSNIEDVNHEIYGGFYDQRVFGESFEEPASYVNFRDWKRYSGYWTPLEAGVEVIPGRNSTSDVFMNGIHPIGVEPDQSAKLIYEKAKAVTVEADIKFTGKGESGGVLVSVSNAGIGNDAFNGYEISINRDGNKLLLGKHRNDFVSLKEVVVKFDPLKWNKLKVWVDKTIITVFLNGTEVLQFKDDKDPLPAGFVGLRTWRSSIAFRNITVDAKMADLLHDANHQVSYSWDPVNTGNVQTKLYVDSTTAYNTKKSQVIEFVGGKGIAGIANRSLNRWGFAVSQGQEFEGRLYLKTQAYKGPVNVSLQNQEGSVIYASKNITGINTSWKNFPFSLISNATDSNARLVVSIASKGKIWIDQVVLMSKDRYKNLPIRNDIGQMLTNQGLTFLRYAGTMVNSPEYRFKNMIGDPDQRPNYRGHWNHYTTNGFGIEEFLKYCEASGVTPCFAVNIYETPEDMADMVEYLNGNASTKWGAVRAKNGHPKPYGVKYIEIGNEEVIFNGDKKKDYEAYVERFILLSEAMKKKDASLVLIHSAWWRPDSPNMEFVFRALNGKADYWDLHVGGDDPKAGLETDKQISNMLLKFRTWDSKTTMKIAVFEENGSKHGMQRALGHATNMNAIRRYSEDVLTSSPANALEPYLQNDNDWNQGQLFFTNKQVWGMPPFYSQKMQAENHLPLRVNSIVEGNLDVTATLSEDGKSLNVHVVNFEDAEVSAEIVLGEFGRPLSSTQVLTIQGELTAKNSPGEPDKYKTLESTLTAQNDRPMVRFAPYSYTILKFRN